MWRTAGPAAPHASTAISLSDRAPASAPKTATTGAVRGKPEPRRALLAARAAVRDRDRAPDDAHLRAVPARDLVREEQPPRERRREPVGEPEVRVRLGQRRRDPAQPRGEHHRPGDVAARAEDDVRAAPGEDPRGSATGAAEARQAARSWAALGRAREARDGKRVEREARLRHQPRLDAVGSAGERHRHSALAERLPDCESGPDVTGRSPGRDHARELRRRAHSPRC